MLGIIKVGALEVQVGAWKIRVGALEIEDRCLHLELEPYTYCTYFIVSILLKNITHT